MSWEVAVEPYDGPIAQRLIEEVQAEYVVRYGSVDESPVDPGEFTPPRGLLLVGSADGVPVAMGGFRVWLPGVAEIKRMYVPAQHRGNGYSRRLLVSIEQAARDAGCTEVWLNTGIQQPEAIGLYESSGYLTIAPFGHYADAPDACFYGKPL